MLFAVRTDNEKLAEAVANDIVAAWSSRVQWPGVLSWAVEVREG